MDGNKLTWIDEITATSPANFNRMEDLIQDAVEDSKQRGHAFDRPPASAATKNWIWIDDSTGIASYCDGADWWDIAPGPHLHDIVDVNGLEARIPWEPVVGTLSTNVNIAGSPGTSVTLDGGYVLNGALTGGGRVLLLGQTDPKQNGIYFYFYNGFSGASSWSRPSDANNNAQYMKGRRVSVLNGPYAGVDLVYSGIDFPGVETNADTITFRSTVGPGEPTASGRYRIWGPYQSATQSPGASTGGAWDIAVPAALAAIGVANIGYGIEFEHVAGGSEWVSRSVSWIGGGVFRVYYYNHWPSGVSQFKIKLTFYTTA